MSAAQVERHHLMAAMMTTNRIKVEMFMACAHMHHQVAAIMEVLEVKWNWLQHMLGKPTCWLQ